MRLLAAAAILWLGVWPASAADTAAQTAEAAAAGLRAAITDLDAARSGRDRVAALTRTIRAYEVGQTALRDGLRRVSIREREITASFEARRDRLEQVLGVLAGMERTGEPLLLFHPSGPKATARAGMILSSVTPALRAEADSLKAELAELASLRKLQQQAADTLQGGLVAAQEARLALSQAMQDRTGLPRRFLEDPAELQALVQNADTLDGFATAISGLESDVGAPGTEFTAEKGALPLPVEGRLLRRPGEPDAAGIVRPGIVVATRGQALVTTPTAATIRFRGPLLDYGNVMILEPQAGYLLVLAGLGTVYGATGDILEVGAPVGLMGGAEAAEALQNGRDGPAPERGGASRPETLYIEVRQGERPLDPMEWFAGLDN